MSNNFKSNKNKIKNKKMYKLGSQFGLNFRHGQFNLNVPPIYPQAHDLGCVWLQLGIQMAISNYGHYCKKIASQTALKHTEK
jgi:hypothetical protein